MVKNFLVELLGTFQPQEITSFKAFLASPYFNSGHNSQILIHLFDIHCNARENGTLDSLEKSALYSMLYPGKPLVESRIDKLMSEMKGLLEKFLLTNRYLSTENESLQTLGLLREMRLRGLESRYRQYSDRIDKTLEESLETQEGNMLLYFKANEEHDWLSVYNKSKGDLAIPNVITRLDKYYYIQKTEMLNRLLLQKRQTLLAGDVDNISTEKWVVPSNYLGQSAILDITWEIHRLLIGENLSAEGFYALLTMLQQQSHKIRPELLAHYYIYLRNICTLLIDDGHTEFIQVCHDIQKDNLARGYFYYQGKISPYLLLNITQVALHINAFEWVQAFLEEHRDRILGENETRDFYNMNRALCLFAEKKYTEALDLIPFGSTYSTYHLLARRLELKIYYELQSDLLDFKIDAFKMYIRRAGQKLLPKQFHEIFANFVNILHQLNQSVGKRDKARSELLIKRINNKKKITDRFWLLEKARELAR